MKKITVNWKRILRIVSILGMLVAIYFLLAGITFLSTVKDDDGYFKTWDMNVSKESYALMINPNADWIMNDKSATDIQTTLEIASAGSSVMKISAKSNDPSKEIFIGIAEPSDILPWLDDSMYHEIDSIMIFPPIVGTETRNAYGGSAPDPPGSQTFWLAVCTGEAAQQIQWNTKDGTALVLMNNDGSSGVDINLSIWTYQNFRSFMGISNLGLSVVIMILSLFGFLSTRKHPTFGYAVPAGMLPKK